MTGASGQSHARGLVTFIIGQQDRKGLSHNSPSWLHPRGCTARRLPCGGYSLIHQPSQHLVNARTARPTSCGTLTGNITVFVAFMPTHALPHSVWSNALAPLLNMLSMYTTFDTSHWERLSLKEIASAPRNIECMVMVSDTSPFDKSALNELAWLNTPFMFLTLDTVHLDRSKLRGIVHRTFRTCR